MTSVTWGMGYIRTPNVKRINRVNISDHAQKILQDYPKGLTNMNLKIVGGDFLRFAAQPLLLII